MVAVVFDLTGVFHVCVAINNISGAINRLEKMNDEKGYMAFYWH